MILNLLASLVISPLQARSFEIGSRMVEEEFSFPTIWVAYGFLIWYAVVISLSANGFFVILLKFRRSSQTVKPQPTHVEGVSILRPLKGIDPQMEACLESSFLQDYPTESFELLFCVADPSDPSIPIVTNLCKKYSHIDTKILVGSLESPDYYGPNPKINNLAKGYTAAKFDIVWVLDSNVKVFPGALQRSVAALIESTDNGTKTSRKVKLVHHLPLAVASDYDSTSRFSFGAMCDEMFLLTAHAKFYVSLNKVSMRPCVNGKSNLYRKSDLDFAVSEIGKGFTPSADGKSGVLGRDAAFYSAQPNNGIKLFARYIGEDNMIGIALWDHCNSRTGMTGDAVVQPLGGQNSIKDYCNRRIRWLRVRKYMVLMATLLEPSTESILSGLFGTFAISVLYLNCYFSKLVFVLHMLLWFAIDQYQYRCLMEFTDKQFQLSKFIQFWSLREILALPIWIVAMLGQKIDWRGKPFIIKRNLCAEEY